MAALMAWMQTLPQGDVAIRIQLPPVLEPFRQVLNKVLDGRTTVEDWAQLVAVADALDAMIAAGNLAYPANVVAMQAGDLESQLVERPPRPEGWEAAILQLRQLLEEASGPVAHLPAVQEAAMQLLRGISRRIPSESYGL